jgi:DNA sulfur modification protein DndB
MFTEQKMHEIEPMLKEKRKLDLKVGQVAELQATRGQQFGREVFTSTILFKDLRKFLTVFPNVQRDLNPIKVAKIKTYIFTGLTEEDPMRFFSAITCTCRGNLFYDEKNQRMAIDVHQSRLSVNDGQHRFVAIAEAIDELIIKHDNALNRDKLRANALREQIEDLENMTIPLVIFNQISESAEKQLFHDINLLASRPSRSATVRLAQTDLVAVLSRELATTNKFFNDYGVEYDKANIAQTNQNFILLTTIYTTIKDMFREFSANGKVNTYVSEESYDDNLIYMNETYNEIFRALPYDIFNKDVYFAFKHFVMKGIVRFIKKHRKDGMPEPLIFGAIKKVDWTNNVEYWGQYGARMGERHHHQSLVFAEGEKAITQVMSALEYEMSKLTQGE